MKNIVLLLFLVVSGFETLAVYPISPRPLRQLIIESEYIISGHVIEIVKKKQKKNEYGSGHVARIKIMEVLQGFIQEKIVEVSYSANMICPAPPRFIEDTDVIVFLNKNDKQYRIVALSYGLKTLTLPEMADYKARITEMQQILTITDKDEQFMQTVEWLVKCAESPTTRREGTFELSPMSDFMSYYSRTQAPSYQYMLSKEQKLRLKNALFATNGRYADFGLIDLVYADYEAEIRGYLLQSLKKIDDDHLWFADSYMQRLLYGKDSPEMKLLADNFADIQFKDDQKDEMKSIISEFIILAEK